MVADEQAARLARATAAVAAQHEVFVKRGRSYAGVVARAALAAADGPAARTCAPARELVVADAHVAPEEED